MRLVLTGLALLLGLQVATFMSSRDLSNAVPQLIQQLSQWIKDHQMALRANITTTDGYIVEVYCPRADYASDALWREAFATECHYWSTHRLIPES